MKKVTSFVKRNRWQTIIILFGSFLIYQGYPIVGAGIIGIGFGTLD